MQVRITELNEKHFRDCISYYDLSINAGTTAFILHILVPQYWTEDISVPKKVGIGTHGAITWGCVYWSQAGS